MNCINGKAGCGCGNSCGSRCSGNCSNTHSGNCGSSQCNRNCKCDCDFDKHSSLHNDPLKGMPLGIGYVPWQQWDCVYSLEEGLSKGTIFPPLDLPFYGCIPRGFRCKKGGVS